MNRFSAPTTTRLVSTAVENGVVLEAVATDVTYRNEDMKDILTFKYVERTQDGYRTSIKAKCYLNGNQIDVSTGYGILAAQFTYDRS